MTKVERQALCIAPTNTIREAMVCIDRNERGLAIVVDAEWHLLGTITDGDVRRAMLLGVNLDASVGVILEGKVRSPYPKPIAAPIGCSDETLLRLMRENQIRQVPLLDDAGCVVDLVTIDDLVPSHTPRLQAVIMAGGQGTRLRPLTEALPKPMLPVGGRPLMEIIVEQLQQLGVRQVSVATHYKPERIIEHFGDGKAFGVEMSYVNEDRPLGTGGALGLMRPPEGPVLVINGDILTQVDFRAMVEFHGEYKAEMTVAVRRYDVKVPYAVIECEGSFVRQLKEKPQMVYLVNAGIYLLEPSVYELIPMGKHFNMTDLIQWLLDAGRPVVSFPICEYWLDIGHPADYVQAQNDVVNGKMAN